MWVSSASTASFWRRAPRTASRPPDREALARAPVLIAPRARLAGLLNGRVNQLAASGAPGAVNDLPDAFLVDKQVARLEQHREDRARRLLTRCWRSLRRPLGPHQAKTVCSVPVGGLAASRRARLRPPDAAHLIGQLTHGSAYALTPCATPPSLLGSRPGG